VRQDLDAIEAVTLEEVNGLMSQYPLSKSATLTIGPLKECRPPG